jgi:hypothetical protein
VEERLNEGFRQDHTPFIKFGAVSIDARQVTAIEPL